MFIFLDLEASSLTNGYPTEVGWVRHEDGATYSALIRPEPDWIERCNWDPAAEVVTGISPAELNSSGRPKTDVAADLVRDLAGHRVFANGGQHDVAWFRMITAPAVIPLEDFDGLLAAAAFRGGWTGLVGAGVLEIAIRSAKAASGLREHRALDDAMALLNAFELALAGPPPDLDLKGSHG